MCESSYEIDLDYEDYDMDEDLESGIGSGYDLTANGSSKFQSFKDSESDGDETFETCIEEEQTVEAFYSNFDYMVKNQFGDWSLEEVGLDSPLLQPHQNSRWKKLQIEGKAKYRCRDCRHTWTSNVSSLLFFFRPFPDLDGGCVRFYLYGQMCRQCQEYYVIPQWYDDEAERAVFLLFAVLGESYHGLKIDTADGHVKRYGEPKGPHQKSLCEACQTGMCPYAKLSD